MSIRKKWYLHIMQADASRSLSWGISATGLHILITVILIGLILFAAGAYRVWNRNSDLANYDRMKKENDLLRHRLTHFSTQMDSLLIKVRIMENWEDELRNERKLKIVSPDVRALGSGGQPYYDPSFLMFDEALDRIYNENLSKLIYVQSKITLIYETHSELIYSLQNQEFLYQATPSIWPTYGNITSRFGYRAHPIFSRTTFHAGIDIANDRGTPIYATAEGVVSHAAYSGQSGLLVRIDHASGYQTRYAHLDRVHVKAGDFVEKGQIIARMGNSGNSTGAHLHYEVVLKQNRKWLNPSNFFDLVETQTRVTQNDDVRFGTREISEKYMKDI